MLLNSIYPFSPPMSNFQLLDENIDSRTDFIPEAILEDDFVSSTGMIGDDGLQVAQAVTDGTSYVAMATPDLSDSDTQEDELDSLPSLEEENPFSAFLAVTLEHMFDGNTLHSQEFEHMVSENDPLMEVECFQIDMDHFVVTSPLLGEHTIFCTYNPDRGLSWSSRARDFAWRGQRVPFADVIPVVDVVEVAPTNFDGVPFVDLQLFVRVPAYELTLAMDHAAMREYLSTLTVAQQACIIAVRDPLGGFIGLAPIQGRFYIVLWVDEHIRWTPVRHMWTNPQPFGDDLRVLAVGDDAVVVPLTTEPPECAYQGERRTGPYVCDLFDEVLDAGVCVIYRDAVDTLPFGATRDDISQRHADFHRQIIYQERLSAATREWFTRMAVDLMAVFCAACAGYRFYNRE